MCRRTAESPGPQAVRSRARLSVASLGTWRLSWPVRGAGSWRGRARCRGGRARYPGPICVPATGTARSASFGVLAAVQLHDVGVVAAAWLCDAGVLAAVQLHDTEAAPGDQLAQAPHPAHARERASYGGRADPSATQRE